MNLTIEEHRRQFLAILFEDLPGLIEVRSFHPVGGPRRVFCKDIDAALGAIQSDFESGCNVYVGMATRGTLISEETGRISGGKDNLIACRALWVDRDGLTEEGAREEWEIVLEGFHLTPSMRVDSGGGEHSYWTLEEPIQFDTETLAVFEHTLKGLADILECDPSATDASRILRVPGTVNLPGEEKRAKGRVDARCRILSQTGELYQLEDFEDFTIRGETVKRLAPKTTVPQDGTLGKFQHPNRHEAITRHCAFLRKSGLSIEAAEAALLVFNEQRCDPPKSDEEVIEISRWSHCVALGDNNALEIEKGAELSREEDRVAWMRRQLVNSINAGDPIEDHEIDLSVEALAPRYPSGVSGLITYGNTILLADGGVGKTMLGIGMAIESAAGPDWEVVYFNSELDRPELNTRIGRYAGAMIGGRQFMDHAHFKNTNSGISIKSIVEKCVFAVHETRKLLVVIDSINTISEDIALKSGRNPLEELSILYNWSTKVRKSTEGEVSFLIVSETNAGGGVKGRKGYFSGDVVVLMSKSEQRDTVNIDVMKSRSDSNADLGIYQREWKTGRFTK